MILTIKEMMILFDCSESTALHHMKNIRESQCTKFVTKYHLAEYLCIDYLAVEASYQAKVKKDTVMSGLMLNMRDQLKKVGHSTTQNKVILDRLVKELETFKIPE